MQNKVFLSSFWIKLIATLLMTIDHIAVFFFTPYATTNSVLSTVYWIMRIIGRLALPLFAFLLSEGLKHTSNKLRYIGRLSIMSLLIILVMVFVEQGSNPQMDFSNIFTDLCLSGLLIVCLQLPKFKKFYTLIPLSLITFCLLNTYLRFIPTSVINLQYSFYGILLVLGFYYSNYLTNIYARNYCSNYQIDHEGYLLTQNYQFMSNIFASIALVIVNLGCWMIFKVYPDLNILTFDLQVISILSFIFIVFYNGKRGYNKKWFQYGMYLYYPLHIILLFGLSFLF